MSVFGFIENFFFISLALVFVLVLLLVYHFKNRITIAEKKSESMYGLLTAVVKEIKSLRGMFGMVHEQSATPPSSFEVKSKTEPECIVPPSADSEPLPDLKKEVIVLDFSASEDKIVVSDDELSDESDTDSESESDEEDDMDIDLDITIPEPHEQSFQEYSDSATNIAELTVESVHANIAEDLTLEEVDVSLDIVENTQEHVDLPENTEEVSQEQPESLEDKKETHEQTVAPIPTLDQLRKMNITQLKTVASQIGVASDVTKLKKPELISLIQTVSS